MDLETPFQVLRVQEPALVRIRMQVHETPHLVNSQETTLAVFANSPAQFTTATHTPDILVKTGVQVPTGLAFRGKMLQDMFQETHQHKTITNGIQMRPRSSFQFPMKVQRTATHHNKQMT